MTEPVEAVEVVEVEDTEPENWKTSNLAVAGKMEIHFFWNWNGTNIYGNVVKPCKAHITQ